jgi:hypothetical protein
MSRLDSDLDAFEWLNQPEPDEQDEPEPELPFCDACGVVYTTTCACDTGDDR